MDDLAGNVGSADGAHAKGAEALLPLVYEELRRLAASRMALEPPGQTIQPTALVHEAWLRLAGKDASAPFANRAHFFSAAAEAMRRILIDRARRKTAEKRGGHQERIDLDNVDIAVEADEDTLLLVNESLEKLAQEDAQAAEIVKLRFFGGLTLEEAGQVVGCSERTAKRCWAFLRGQQRLDWIQSVQKDDLCDPKQPQQICGFACCPSRQEKAAKEKGRKSNEDNLGRSKRFQNRLVNRPLRFHCGARSNRATALHQYFGKPLGQWRN